MQSLESAWPVHGRCMAVCYDTEALAHSAARQCKTARQCKEHVNAKNMSRSLEECESVKTTRSVQRLMTYKLFII